MRLWQLGQKGRFVGRPLHGGFWSWEKLAVDIDASRDKIRDKTCGELTMHGARHWLTKELRGIKTHRPSPRAFYLPFLQKNLPLPDRTVQWLKKVQHRHCLYLSSVKDSEAFDDVRQLTGRTLCIPNDVHLSFCLVFIRNISCRRYKRRWYKLLSLALALNRLSIRTKILYSWGQVTQANHVHKLLKSQQKYCSSSIKSNCGVITFSRCCEINNPFLIPILLF